MLLNQITAERKSRPSRQQEKSGPNSNKPGPHPVELETVYPGRPHQAFVESEADKYWRDIAKSGCLTKPTQAEIRGAAMPILCRALRNRPGGKLELYLNMAHHAVADVVEHAREQRWTRRPLSNPYASADYVEALVQLADDTNWLARAVPLPDHLPPKHPPIYYTIDPETDRPVPRAGSLIRADFVYTPEGRRVTHDKFIYPRNRPFFLLPRRYSLWSISWGAYYTLQFGRGDHPEIIIHWMKTEPGYLIQTRDELTSLISSPNQTPAPDLCVIL